MRPKFIPHRVTIQPCKHGNAYMYKGEAFAYVWAWPPFSDAWWKNLCLMANRSTQELIKEGHELAKHRKPIRTPR